ncbi:MAG TPA: iron ABC transporter permease [Candidatus Lustribacter sp.]|nr:iron ABC transporter permease [Candidatus Lustribacter sp.]
MVDSTPVRGRLRRASVADRGNPWLTLPVVLVTAFVSAPIFITLVGSFRISLPGQPTVWGTSGWTSAFSTPSVWQAVANTFILVAMRVPLALLLGSVVAFLLIRCNVRARQTIEFLFWTAFFLPTLPMAMAWALLLDPKSGWINRLLQPVLGLQHGPFNIYSYSGITWVHLVTTTVPAIILLLGPAFRGLNPVLEESARMSGASTIATFRRVVLPLLAPALAMAGIIALIRSLEGFEVELFLGVPAGIRVFTTKIQELVVYEPPRYAPAMALSVPFIILLIVLALWYQRVVRGRSYATLTGKMVAAPPFDLGAWRWPATIFCGLFATLAVIVPTATLLFGSFMEIFGVTNVSGGFGFTISHWTTVLHDPVFLSSFTVTLLLGVFTAAAGVLVFSLIAYIILRTRTAGRDVLDVAAWMPWAIPGILLSLSLLWIYLGFSVLNVLYGSVAGLVVAMLFKEMPGGVNLMKNGIARISLELEEAASTSGAGWWELYRRVLLPLLSPTAVTVALFIFVGCVKDISTMILLATPTTRPLSLLVLDYATNGEIENGAVVGVISAFMAIGVAFLGRRLSQQTGTRN